MAKVCEICEKSAQRGKKVTVAWGVKYRSIRHREPNLRKVTIRYQGEPVQVQVCAKCLKSIKLGLYKGFTPYFTSEASKGAQRGDFVSEANKTA